MNDGNVASFACKRWHPQLGDKAVCTRQRHHAGDHRSHHDGRVREWADPGILERAFNHADPPPATLFPPPALDPSTDPFPPPQEAAVQPDRPVRRDRKDRPPSAGFWAFAAYVELVALVLLILCAPAIIAAAYRWGF